MLILATLKAEIMSLRWIEKLRVVKYKPADKKVQLRSIIKETAANNLKTINPLKWRSY